MPIDELAERDGQTLFEICARLTTRHGLGSSRQAISQRIDLTSVLVDDQDKALRFYTEVLGFTLENDIPMGPARWITVVSPEDPDGIPFTSFAVDDVRVEFDRLRALGVRFTRQPVDMGPVTTAVLDDTCGNLIQIAHQK